MYELCLAVYQRAVALGGALPSFYKADNSTTNNPSMADLYLLKATGANCQAYRNLSAVRNFITGTLAAGRWMTTSGGPTAYTVASMETAIGASLDLPAKVNEARAWQAYQDALDRMIYAYTELDERGVGYTNSGYYSDTESTLQDAWDGRTTNTGVPGGPVTPLDPKAFWYITDGFVATVRHTVSGLIFRLGTATTAATLGGVLVSAEYVYDSVFDNCTLGSVDFDLDGDIITINSTETGGTATATPTMDSALSLDLTIDTAEPSTVPFSLGGDSSGTVALRPTALNVYHDLETILTDQA